MQCKQTRGSEQYLYIYIHLARHAREHTTQPRFVVIAAHVTSADQSNRPTFVVYPASETWSIAARTLRCIYASYKSNIILSSKLYAYSSIFFGLSWHPSPLILHFLVLHHPVFRAHASWSGQCSINRQLTPIWWSILVIDPFYLAWGSIMIGTVMLDLIQTSLIIILIILAYSPTCSLLLRPNIDNNSNNNDVELGLIYRASGHLLTGSTS